MTPLNKHGKTIGTGLAGPGRPAGSPNRVTTEVREALSDLVADNVPRLQEWLDRVAKHNPKAALEIYVKLVEFVVPRLARHSLEASNEPKPLPFAGENRPTTDTASASLIPQVAIAFHQSATARPCTAQDYDELYVAITCPPCCTSKFPEEVCAHC